MILVGLSCAVLSHSVVSYLHSIHWYTDRKRPLTSCLYPPCSHCLSQMSKTCQPRLSCGKWISLYHSSTEQKSQVTRPEANPAGRDHMGQRWARGSQHTEAGPEFPNDAGLAWSGHFLRARPRPSPLRSLSVPSEYTYHFELSSNSCSYILALCPGAPWWECLHPPGR